MPAGAEPMSPRETEVLEGLREHLTNAEIGQRLHISVRTVESHVSSLLRKLGAADRRELAARAATVLDSSRREPMELRGLPRTWTTFVGRSAELAQVEKALADARLVTLVGPGGVGKTRLAVAATAGAAPDFSAGGAFVDLVPVSAEFVTEGVAAALGVAERAQQPLAEAVQDRLRAGPALLVLDNCEHVLDAAATFAATVLASCPEAVILATSRERLGVPGERVVPISPLSLAVRGDEVGSEAELLFVDRIGDVPGIARDPRLIGEVCRRLEGLPLAIELAAARCGSLGLDGLLAGLEDRLRLLSRSSGGAGRHGSLRSVLEWSCQLLDDAEGRLFEHLGAFAGAVDLAAVAEVAGDGDMAATSDLIGRLADKSLVVHLNGPDGSRWGMLDTVRAYARERLRASEQAQSIGGRYVAWAATTAGALEQSLDGRGDWQDRFDLVIDDLRAALAGVSATGGEGAAFELALSLGHLCYARRFLAEGRDHLGTAVELARDDASAVHALRLAARAAFAEMRGEPAFNLLRAAHDRALAAGDPRTAAITLSEASAIGGRCPALFQTPLTHDQLVPMVEQARAIAPPDDVEVGAYLALAAAWDNARGLAAPDPVRAREALSAARQFGDPVVLSVALDAATAALADDGHYKEAWRLTGERMELLDRLPRHDPRVGGEVADIFHMASESALGAGELHAALASARRAYDDSTREGLAHFAAADLVIPLALQGAFDDALVQGTVMRDGWERAGRPAAGWLGPASYAVALVHGLRGDDDAYARWWHLATTICRERGINAFSFYTAARVALHRGEIDRARAAALVDGQEATGLFLPYAEVMSVEVAVAAGAPDAADRIVAAWHLGEENDFAAAQLWRAAGMLHDSVSELEEAVSRWEALGARFERASTLLHIPETADEGVRELAALGCSAQDPPASSRP